MKPGEETGSSGSFWVVISILHPSMSRAAGEVLSNPLLSVETSKSIQEKMKGIKPTESASFLPASEPTGEEKALHGPWESPLFRGRVSWEAGLVSAVMRWNTTALGNTGSCAPSSHHSSAQLYKTGCKLCSFWLTDMIKVMCALQHYEFDGERSPETSLCTRS